MTKVLLALLLVGAPSAFAEETIEDAQVKPVSYVLECLSGATEEIKYSASLKITTDGEINASSTKVTANYAIDGKWNDGADVAAYLVQSKFYRPDLEITVPRITASITVDGQPSLFSLDVKLQEPNADGSSEYNGTLYRDGEKSARVVSCDVMVTGAP
ncbi:MAG TPA: hypothetical protein VM901_01265 [Bdellovibrionota bacterium]|jgi:hypothetical protein|nr:hypothetical protein [Bdellovibrionota bacterium]